jgi:hypothetical protein
MLEVQHLENVACCPSMFDQKASSKALSATSLTLCPDLSHLVGSFPER